MTTKIKIFLLEMFYCIIALVSSTINPLEEERPRFVARLPMDWGLPQLSSSDEEIENIFIAPYSINEPIKNDNLLTIADMPDIISNLDVKFYNFSSENYNKADGKIYLEDIYNYLKDLAPKGMWISAALAQAYTEGGSGKNNGGVYSKTNNCFGITAGPGWEGFVYSRDTGKLYKNYATAQKYKAKDLFRAYLSIEESIQDYVSLIQTDRYKNALIQNSYKKYLKILIDSGYGEEHMYETWIDIIKMFKLTEYD